MIKLPRNVWIIAACSSMTMAGVSMLVFVGGIIGTKLAAQTSLATLPIALFVVGNAFMAVPAVMLAKKFGRKTSAYIGFSISQLSTVLSVVALQLESFTLFCIAGAFMGCGTAFYHQLRFAAMESLSDEKDSGPALSLIMLSNIVGAVLGPELADLGRTLLPGFSDYSGTFFLNAGLLLLAMLLFLGFRNPLTQHDTNSESPRALAQIARQPGFLIAVASATIGYAVMSFLMTSTPLSMHIVDGHSLDAAKGVLQSHLVAMFLPSLFSGYFIRKFGPEKIMLLGSLLYLLVIMIALSGQKVIHYWWALVILGVGWNFLFLSGTSLLPRYYKPCERFRAQALNEFSVFGLQALASLSAAWILFGISWRAQVWICLLPTLGLGLCALWLAATKKPAAASS